MSGQPGYGYNADTAPLMSNGGYGPQGSFPPHGGYGPAGGAQGGSYPPQGNYSAPPTNVQQPYPQGSYASQQSGTTLKGMAANGNMNDVFFAAACCIMLGSFVTGMIFLFSFKLVDFMALSYLTFFGGILAVLDTPFFKTIKMVMDAKMYIGKYIQFVTRVTGKGVAFVFLASMLFETMWDNLEGAFLAFLAIVLCLVPALVGIGAVTIGILKSKKLDKARRQLYLIIEQRYDQYATKHPGEDGGLTMHEFNMLTVENGEFRFQSLDLKLIFNALVSNPSWRQTPANATQSGYTNANEEVKIPKKDLLEWCKGGFVFL